MVRLECYPFVREPGSCYAMREREFARVKNGTKVQQIFQKCKFSDKKNMENYQKSTVIDCICGF